MRARISLVIGAAAWLLSFSAQPAGAASFGLAFSTWPASGAIVGEIGHPAGWGYSITNLDTDGRWLRTVSVSDTGFLHGTPDASVFLDSPALAPGDSFTVFFQPEVRGLFQFTFDHGTPRSAVETGSFFVGLEWYTGDPGAGGLPVADTTPGFVGEIQSPFFVTVPEPASLLLLALGAGFACWRRRPC